MKRIVTLILIVCFVFVCISCGTKEEHFINENIKYYSAEELEDVFLSNEEQFSEMAKIMLDNDDFYMEKEARDGDGDARVIANQDKQYFSEEEWEKIEEFFKNIAPLDVTRYQGFIIGFHFPMNDEGYTSTLYYFSHGTYMLEFDYHESHADSFKEIKEKWWIGEKKFFIDFDDLERERFEWLRVPNNPVEWVVLGAEKLVAILIKG